MSISSLLGLGQQRFLRQPLSSPNNPRPRLLLSSCTLNSFPNSIKPHPNPSLLSSHTPNLSSLPDTRSNFKGNGGDDGGGSGSGRWGRSWWSGDESSEPEGGWLCSLPLLLVLLFVLVFEGPALARALALAGGVWEVRGGTWTRLVPDADSDSFVVVGSGKDEDHSKSTSRLESCWRQCRDLFLNLMLPEGYPDSVSSDYLQYSLWRGLQGIASQMNGVLATQSLLYAVGLGKGAIPTAAAVNWVLKDGIGYLSKILLSNFGRHFDVHPKGWRLFADLLENAAYGLEIVTPSFPQYFVLIGATAGAGRSAAALIQGLGMK